jgi:hypothetical protein
MGSLSKLVSFGATHGSFDDIWPFLLMLVMFIFAGVFYMKSMG